MRRRVTITIPAVVRITGLVDIPDHEPTPEGEEPLTDEQLEQRAQAAATEAAARTITDLRDRFGTVMAGRWPELLHGAELECSLVPDDGEPRGQIDVHPIA